MPQLPVQLLKVHFKAFACKDKSELNAVTSPVVANDTVMTIIAIIIFLINFIYYSMYK
jgi:hypothetical protein